MCESNLASPDYYYIGDNSFVDLDIVERTSQCCELSRLNISSPITNIPHLTNLVIGLYMPLDENFDYYSITDCNSDNDIIECSSNAKSFSALNCNIRSLAANNDNFLHMLSELNFSFSLIGLSETKLKVDKNPLTNTNIPGYDFISQPSFTNAGGVAFYIKNYLNYTIQSEFTTSKLDFEALWIEIQIVGQQNVICGHPNGNMDNFINYINLVIEKIHQEEKLWYMT